MQKPTTSDPSFKNFIEGLKNTNVSAVEPRPVQVGQLQPESDVVGSQTEGLNTLYREEKDANKEQKEFYKLQKQHNLIQENQFKLIIKSLENLNKLFSVKTGIQSKKDGEGKEGKLDYKGLPDQAKDLTYSEVLKQGVAKVKGVGSSVKSMGKSIVSAFKDPASAVKSLYSNVKGSTKSMVENVKDIASTKEDYTPEQERFATSYAASAKGTQFQKGGKSALEAGKDKYDALKAKEEEINVVKEKMAVPASQGFDPLKKDVKELSKLENQFASIDPRVKKEEVLNNKINTEVVKQEQESKVTGGKGADKPVMVNQESDNVVSAPEAIAEETKADLEVSKQLLETTREQLTVLKEIKEALSPETPRELTEQKSAPSATEKNSGGGSLLDTAMDLGSDLLGRNKGVPGKGVPKGPGKPSLGSRMMGGIKGIGGKLGGLGGIAKGAAGVLGKLAVPLAVATAGYDAYKGVERTGENFDLKEGEEATLGQKTSSALGSVASGFSFGMLDEKEAAQGINKAGSAVKDFFGFGEDKKAGAAGGKIPGGGQITDPNAPGYNTDAAEYQRDKESILAAAKPAETVAGKKGSIRADDQKLISEGKTVKTEVDKSGAQKAGIIPGGGQITDPNASGYNADAAEYQRDKQNIIAKDAKVTPVKATPVGANVAKTSTENADMGREAGKGGGNNTVVSNNVSTNNTTTYVPIKAAPRSESQGSALDRYQNRVTVY
jgi:hypothetical protein